MIDDPKALSRLGTILGVWAHPDDETFTCAGIMAAAVSNGQRVACITATRGEAGVQDPKRWPPDQLASIRSAELMASLQILGVSEHYWLPYEDGDCDGVDEQAAVRQLTDIIAKVRPDTILTFGPDGMTGHPDHCCVSRWASHAAELSDVKPDIYHAVELRDNYEKYLKPVDERFNIYFNIDKPPLREAEECDLCFCLPPGLRTLKRQALAAMPSQTEGLLSVLDEQACQQIFRCEQFVRAA